MRDGPRRFTRDFSCPALLRNRLDRMARFRVRGSHPLRRPFPGAFRYRPTPPPTAALLPRARPRDRPGLGCCAFARRYWRNRCYFLFLRVLRCFSSPRSLDASWRRGGGAAAGLPQSEIRGSQGICPSPRLIAACHVLRRLREPWASPARLCPLSSLPFYEPPISSRVFGSLGFALYTLVFTYSYICPYSCIYILWLCSIRSLDFSRFRYVLEVLRSQHVKDLSAVPVEDNGLEPLTPCLQSRCSTKLS